jgi:O-antigen ligase
MRDRLAYALNLLMEGVIALLAIGSVWPFGSVLPFFQWLLFAAIAFLLVLWGAKAVVEGRLLWKPCPVVICLAALCLMTMLQVIPLPTAWVRNLSPNTTPLREKLLPSPEETGVEQAVETTATLSIAPGATRLELLRLFAVLGLFAAVRNSMVDPGSLYRLSWLLYANGVLLALIGMGQLTSSPSNMIYWSVSTSNQVFGPFVCRNHAAYYLNLCLGLSAGLLLGTRYFLTSERGASSWRGMFRDARILWLISGIGIMLAGLLATLSRGGFIGFALGALACFVLLVMNYGKRIPWIGGGVIVGMATLLVFWLGSDRLSQRWEKFGDKNSAPAARVEVWARSLPLVQSFPFFGTGLGTFGHVEQTRRHPGDDANVFYDHAHNDYLELWVEGGTIQLLLALAIAFLVLRNGYRAFRRHGDTGLGRLALGALLAFIAILVHSFVDFGLHIPAVAVLASVVGAMLMNLAEMPAANRLRAPRPNAPPSIQSYGLAVLEAVSLFLVAWFLFRAGWDDQQAERYLWASTQAPLADRIGYLQSAIAYAPDRADLYWPLADAHVEVYLERKKQRDAADLAALIAAAGSARYPGVLAFCDRSAIRVSEKELETANLLLVQACRKNPLLYEAQARLEKLSTIGSLRDFKGKRLERLVYLSPSDPAPWYWLGKQALRDRDRAKAFAAFRNSLRADKKFLTDIVKAIPESMNRAELLHDVLPPDPALILKAVEELSKADEDFAEKTAYYKESLRLLDAKSEPLTADEWKAKAETQIGLGDYAAARKSYEAALERSPMDSYLRFDYGKLLVRTGDLKEARHQLARVMFDNPQNWRAQNLQKEVLDRLAGRE